MGYRSYVRSVIYGDPDKMWPLIAKDEMTDGIISLYKREGALSIYQITRRLYRGVVEDVTGQKHARYDDVPAIVIDLIGDGWKWYEDYPDVKRWHELLAEAAELELNTEFARLGEECDDNQLDCNIQDAGDQLLDINRAIDWAGPEREEIDECSTTTISTNTSSSSLTEITPSDASGSA